MVLVNLEDGTCYIYDTDTEYSARYDAARKLRDRLDARKIVSTINIPVDIKEDTKYVNIPNDSRPLKAWKGWSYKWEHRSAEFR